MQSTVLGAELDAHSSALAAAALEVITLLLCSLTVTFR